MSDTPALGKREVNRARYDVPTMTLGIVSNKGLERAYNASELPEHICAALALRGLFYVLRTADDPDAAFADLKAGKLAEHGPAKPKELPPWKRAFAAALVEQTKKTTSPYTQEGALAKAIELTPAQLRAIKSDPLVVKYYRRITGTSVSVDLLALIDGDAAPEAVAAE